MNYFNDLSGFLKRKFGKRTFKVSLDSGFGCPNWDEGSCTFCDNRSFAPLVSELSIEDQFNVGKDYIVKRHSAEKFIAYFQTGSATYGPLEILHSHWMSVVAHDDVLGVVVSTRPDCIDDNVLEKLSLVKERTKIFWIELGLQSSNEDTLKRINRGHGVQEFKDAFERAREKNLNVCAHVIIGLPGESRDDMIRTADFLNDLGVWGVKIHNFHVVKGTRAEEEYLKKRINILELEEYAGLVVDFIERLNPEIIIHRINAHAPRRLTIAPKWSINKLGVHNAVFDEFRRRKTSQGVGIKP